MEVPPTREEKELIDSLVEEWRWRRADTITAVINTGVEYVANWLENHTQNAASVDISIGDGRHVGLSPAKYLRTTKSKKRILEMQGILMVMDGAQDVASSSSSLVRFELVPLASERVEMSVRFIDARVAPYVTSLLEDVAKRWPKAKIAREFYPLTAKKKVEPTVRTKERAKLYRDLKQAHLGWSYAQVAVQANEQENVDYHTQDTVRNAYRAMGWKWERADRIR